MPDELLVFGLFPLGGVLVGVAASLERRGSDLVVGVCVSVFAALRLLANCRQAQSPCP